ncbi:MAG: thrombospondin type 3 repeat-containing protein, partial [Pseudomonadales bacterium]
ANGLSDPSNQVDTDGDGIGNACDPDYDNDGVVGGADFAVFSAAFGLRIGDAGYNPDVDHDGDDVIGITDLGIITQYFSQGPGDSGLPCADPLGSTAPCYDLFGTGDTDGDHVINSEDNCTLHRNGIVDASNQIDADTDGFGNACDADYNNDGITDQDDFDAFSDAFGLTIGDPQYDPEIDSNGDDVIGAADFGIFTQLFGQGAGPSGLMCAVNSQGKDPCYLQYSTGDTDGDHVINQQDNCVLHRNGTVEASNQIDSNLDGFGNACDPDFDNDNKVERKERARLNQAQGSTPGDPDYDPDLDLDGDDVITSKDVGILDKFLNGPPGPSGLICADPYAQTVCE